MTKQTKQVELILGDCLEKMRDIPDGSVDAIITDPPYKVIRGGATQTAKTFSSVVDWKNDGKIFAHNEIGFREYLPEAYRVLKNETHLYLMTNTLNMETALREARLTGFNLHNILVWVKNNCTPNRWYMKNVEYTLFFRKGKAKTINLVSSKTAHNVNNVSNKTHPTEKPVKLMEFYIFNSTNEGDTILDPFMGSGTTGVACKNLNRNFIGIELDENYFEIARKRISQTLQQEQE